MPASWKCLQFHPEVQKWTSGAIDDSNAIHVCMDTMKCTDISTYPFQQNRNALPNERWNFTFLFYLIFMFLLVVSPCCCCCCCFFFGCCCWSSLRNHVFHHFPRSIKSIPSVTTPALVSRCVPNVSATRWGVVPRFCRSFSRWCWLLRTTYNFFLHPGYKHQKKQFGKWGEFDVDLLSSKNKGMQICIYN